MSKRKHRVIDRAIAKRYLDLLLDGSRFVWSDRSRYEVYQSNISNDSHITYKIDFQQLPLMTTSIVVYSTYEECINILGNDKDTLH